MSQSIQSDVAKIGQLEVDSLLVNGQSDFVGGYDGIPLNGQDLNLVADKEISNDDYFIMTNGATLHKSPFQDLVRFGINEITFDSLLLSPTAKYVSINDYTFFQRDNQIYKILYSDFVDTIGTMDALETEDGYYIETENYQLLEYESRVVVVSGDLELTVDTSPTYGSSFPVASNGIKIALDMKQDKISALPEIDDLQPTDYIIVQRGDQIYKCLYSNMIN